MNTIKSMFSSVLIVLCMNVYAEGNIQSDKFVERASAGGVAEIEASKLALKNSSSAEVRAFAKQMVSDHTKANAELSKIAKAKNIQVATDSDLIQESQEAELSSLEGKSFDQAYINHQIEAHKEAIALFKSGAEVKDADISTYAKNTLPRLEHHLKMAEELADKTALYDNGEKELHQRNNSAADTNKPE